MKFFTVGIVSLCLSLPLSLAAQTTTSSTPAKKPTAPATTKPAGTTAPKTAPTSSANKATTTQTKQATPATSSAKPAANGTTPAATTAKPDSVVKRRIPETRVERLITEREQLVLQYDYLKTQENNFWGNASKEDMLLVIESLKAVLKKDEEIIQAVEQASLETRRNAAQRSAQLELETKKLNSQVRGDKRVVTDNIYDLKTSLLYAQNLNRRREHEISELKEQLVDADDAKFEHDAIAAVLGLICAGLVGYAIHLRGKLKEAYKIKKTSRKPKMNE